MSSEYDLPPDHAQRMDRALTCLDGLSVGDGFGEQFFYCENVGELIASRASPTPPWRYTDDTVMAISIVNVLDQCGTIDQDLLAHRFAERYRADPHRGYGATAHEVLLEIGSGARWQDVSPAAFGGEGSMGNGGAMRVGPVGAYFADDVDAAVRNARASAEVTHGHADGQAGAIAVAVAAAWPSLID